MKTLYVLRLASTTNIADTRTVQVAIDHADICRHGSFIKLYLIAREYRMDILRRERKRVVTQAVHLVDPVTRELRELRFTIPDRSARWLQPHDVPTGQLPAQWPSYFSTKES